MRGTLLGGTMRPLTIWIAQVSLGGRKSCPSCHVQLEGTNSIVQVGEYIRVRFRLAFYACKLCLHDRVRSSIAQRVQYTFSVRPGCTVPWFDEVCSKEK